MGIPLPEEGPESVRAIREALAELESRGLRYDLDESRPLSPQIRDRLNTLRLVGSILSGTYPAMGGYLVAKSIPDALGSGHAARVFFALLGRAHIHALLAADDAFEHITRLWWETEALLPRIASPRAQQAASLAFRVQAVADRNWCLRFHETLEFADELERFMATEDLGSFWERHFPRGVAVESLWASGQLVRLQQEGPSMIRAARDARNPFLRALLSGTEVHLEMIRDRHQAALAASDLDADRLLGSRFSTVHVTVAAARALALLYAGATAEAKRFTDAFLQRFGSSAPRLVPLISWWVCLVPAGALGAAALAGDRSALASARELRAESWWPQDSSPLPTAMYDALMARLSGDSDAYLQMLLRAEALVTPNVEGYRAPLRRRRGMLIGGDEGAALVREVDAALSAQGVKNPARYCVTLTAMLGMDD